MRKFVYVAMFFVILSFFGCSSSTSNNEDNVQPCINCGITFKALLAKNYPNQIHVDYRSYFTAGSKMSRGTLYARFCSDAACETELTREVVGEDVLLSTGTEQDFSITSAPLGASYIQLGFFTDYASEHLGEPFLQFTVLQTEAATIEANNDEAGDPSTNPEASALSVNISNGNNQDLGTLMLGHIVFNIPVEPTVGEDPKEVWVPAGEEDERTHLDIIREGDGEITEELDPPILEGSEFLGDLCGAVAANDAIYAVAVGLNGAYLFEYDSETHIQTHEHAAFISHPDSDCQEDDPDCFAEAPAEELNVDTFPRPCTGTVVDQNDRRLVYLTRDANDDGTSTSDRLVGIDVTDLSDGTATTVETGSKIDNSLAIRNMAIDSDSLYLTAAGWGNDDSKTRILKYDIPSSDTGTDQLVTTFATAEEIGADCGCASRYTPGTIVATHNGERRLFVGNDDSISVIDVATREEIGQIDITDYGRGITDFALSPDGHTLYAVPACESSVKGTLSSATQSQETDHQQVIILDLANDVDEDGLPDVLYDDRDFDGDGVADGGIDLKFHNLQRDILSWCETCFGVLPPTSICAPKISVGENYLYLRGNAGTASEGSSGLGQMGDIAAFDLSTGEGVIFRNYVPWLDGPSGRWGIPLSATAQATGGMIIP